MTAAASSRPRGSSRAVPGARPASAGQSETSSTLGAFSQAAAALSARIRSAAQAAGARNVLVEAAPGPRGALGLSVEWMDPAGVYWSLSLKPGGLSELVARITVAHAVTNPTAAGATRRGALMDPDRIRFGSPSTTARNQADARARARLLKAEAALKASQAAQDRAGARRLGAAGVTYRDDLEAAPSLAAAQADD